MAVEGAVAKMLEDTRAFTILVTVTVSNGLEELVTLLLLLLLLLILLLVPPEELKLGSIADEDDTTLEVVEDVVVFAVTVTVAVVTDDTTMDGAPEVTLGNTVVVLVVFGCLVTYSAYSASRVSDTVRHTSS